MKDVGKPCKREAYARIDGGRLETGRDHGRRERSRWGNPRGERQDLPSSYATAPVVYPPLVPEGQRRSELDLLRRPPFTPTITGLVRALDRLDRVRGIGAGDLDLSGIPAARVVALARHADQAWATQLADLGATRRVATLAAYTHVLAGSARDDVIDIFDVVFGDMQRAATHRGEKRRASQLRDYDTAVAASTPGCVRCSTGSTTSRA